MASVSLLFVFPAPSALPRPSPPSHLPPFSSRGARDLLVSLPSFEAKPPAHGLFVSAVRSRKARGGGALEAKARGEAADAHGTGGSLDLEAEIYQFMQRSAKPGDFPTKAELIAAGRADLAAAVAAEGGWLALGWDLDGEEVEGKDAGGVVRLDSSETGNGFSKEDGEVDQPRFASASSNADGGFLEASSSGKSIREAEKAVQDGGIEAILSRLEKERNWSYAMVSKGRRVNERASRGNEELDPGGRVLINNKSAVGWHVNCTDTYPEFRNEDRHYSDSFHRESGISANASISSNSGTKTDSFGRPGFPHTDSKANDMLPTEDIKHTGNGISDDSMDRKAHSFARSAADNRKGRNESYSDREQIRARLQHLQSDLTSALSLLRSRDDNITLHKVTENSVSEILRVPDEWEFKEMEVMNARDELRSIRAKMAVLEGKLALEIREAQKIIEEKQTRLDAAQKALCLLCTACIIWPNTASEVLLVGSFDGWTSQRKMERSRAGFFSLYLMLYPGRYEIKFIVDGTWKVDPLRPIVKNNGHENNLLIIT